MQPDLIALLQKYLAGSITEEEQQQLHALLEEEDNQHLLAALIDQQMERTSLELPEHQELKAASFQRLEAAINVPDADIPPQKIRIYRKLRPWAAAAAGIFILAAGLYFVTARKTAPETRIAEINYSKAVPYTRHIILPDSSIIILRANSTLQLLPDFNIRAREVALTGEAYFDIRHNTGKPFTVHTGSLKTTVLGTAFNVIAYAGARQVTVAVTSGKVKVEDHGRTIATLTPDREMVYTFKDATAAQQEVDAYGMVTNWTKKEVLFEAISFGNIADILSRRYGIAIHFKNDMLKDCLVRTAFKGTESLPEMLDLLCTAMNASYTMSDAEGVMINGDGCK